MVAAVHQSVHCVDDRQTGAYVCLEKELDTVVARSLFEGDVIFVGRRRSLFVRGDDRDVSVEEALVQAGDVRTRCAIDKYRIKYIHFEDFLAQDFGVARLPTAVEFVLIVVEVNPLATEKCLPGVCDTDDVQFQAILLHQFGLLLMNLRKEIAAHRAYPGYKNIEDFVFREEERVVDGIKSLAQEFEFYHKGDVRLRSALSTSNYADTCTPQRPK